MLHPTAFMMKEQTTHPRGIRRDTGAQHMKDKYPAKQHLRAVKRHLSQPYKSDHIFLKGSKLIPKGSSDEFYDFHQESNFFYCTGANVPNWYLLYSIRTERLTVFIPKPATGRLAVYIGKSQTPEEVLRAYDVDKAFYYDHIGSVLEELNGMLYTLSDYALSSALTKARMVKDTFEIERCKRANDISRQAHRSIISGLGRSVWRTEKEVEAEFRRVCTVAGGDDQAYSPIVGSGRNASILHYSSNKALLAGSELLLIDAAAKVGGYAADVTRTYPIGGKFSDRGRQLYETVLEMSKLASSALRPGASMRELEVKCHDHLLRQAIKWGWIRCSFETASTLGLTRAFFMHGLGHHIGLDVHDVAENVAFGKLKYLEGPEPVPFVAGNVITIEPGIYFNVEYLQSFYGDFTRGQHLNKAEIDKWVHLGGVRIEDCYLITNNGADDLTQLAKEPAEIERLMQSPLRNFQFSANPLLFSGTTPLTGTTLTYKRAVESTVEPSPKPAVTMESAAPSLSRSSTFTSDEDED